MEQNKNNEHNEIWEELSSIASKGYSAFVLPDKEKKDKRKFMKIHITALYAWKIKPDYILQSREK